MHVFKEMRKNQQIDSIDDVTVAYRGGKIPENETDFLNGNLPEEIHFYLDRFGCENILSNKNPDEDDAKCIENWLNQRWKQKESFLQR